MLQEVPNYRNYRQQYGGNNRLRNLVIRCPAFQMGREGAPEYLCPPRCHRAEISFRLSGLHREHIQILKRVRRLLGCGTWDEGVGKSLRNYYDLLHFQQQQQQPHILHQDHHGPKPIPFALEWANLARNRNVQTLRVLHERVRTQTEAISARGPFLRGHSTRIFYRSPPLQAQRDKW